MTHRCHDRDFLLRFAKDRNHYRELVRENLHKHSVRLLAYSITSNHVHLILSPVEGRSLADFMHDVAGEYARYYNRRKKRSNAVWGGRYHATLIDGGDYLWRCMKYVDLNMVRAGVVTHPLEWAWCSYQEISGKRKRYCLVDKDRIVEGIGQGYTEESFVDAYLTSICHSLERETQIREAKWTESIAVGSKAFIERMRPTIKNRRMLEEVETQSTKQEWILKEAAVEYS